MTKEEAIKKLQAFRVTGDKNHEALDIAIKTLCNKITSLEGCCDQFKWERDIAISQLKELGYELGEKIIHCKDCKWNQKNECMKFADIRPFPDDFCSRAERRTDE